MADVKTNQAKLYKALQGAGFRDLGTPEQFAAKLQDEGNRQKLYNALQKKGFKDLGDYPSFEMRVYDGGTKQSPKVAAQPQPTEKAAVQPAAKPQDVAYINQSVRQPMQMPEGFGQLDVQQAQRMGAGLGPVSWEQPQQEPKEETVVEKQQRMLQGKATPQEQKQVQNRMNQRRDEIAYEEVTGKRLRQPVLNTEFEAPTVWRDENNNILIGNSTDQDRANAHQQIVAGQAAWDSLSEKDKRERMKQMEMDVYEEPGFLGVTGKKLGSGFINTGIGILKAMQELAGGMIVEDASNPTGYSKVSDFNPNSNDPITKGLRNAGEYAEQMSRQGEPRKGASFTDLLKEGDIGGFMLKGWGTGMESLPMTLSAYNPVTMGLNAMSMAGNNYWQETIENPDIPAWKRATYAVGSAAIEQAVEKFADPVFKYVGSGFGKKVAKEVTEEAEKTIAKRIVGVLKDAAGEGAEEIITNFGNDALGSALDWLDGESDYGIVAQWRDLKKKNPNANLADFAMQKADENLNSFFGGALAGAYTSAGAQATVAGLQYALGNTVSAEEIAGNPSAPVHPVTLDIAQHYDNGYSLENDEEKKALSDSYRTLRGQVQEKLGEDVLNEIDQNPTAFLSKIDQLDEETQRIVGEYVGAKAGVDGIQQRIIEENRAIRPNFVVNGNNIDEVDAQGNVVATHEYENADEMRAALWELQARREHNDIMADIAIARANPKYDYDGIIGAFAEEVGLDVDYIESILSKDPLELQDSESAMVSEFAEMLHNTIYDNTTVHEEQSAQDGAETADQMSVDLSEVDPTEAQMMTESWNKAQQAYNDLMARNEDMAQEIQRMEQQGVPHQGIVASLSSFNQSDVQTVIDYYNQMARYQGFLNCLGEKIDEEAANQRQRHTLKGTINGVADVHNVHTITDGTNSYTLVSGDITTDPATGRITGSASGLIIGLDENGDFVNISDTDGFSVLPVTQTLDQYEEAERNRLGQMVTQVVDPNQTMNPDLNQAGAEEKSGNLDNAGGEAGGTNATGGNEPSAAAPFVGGGENAAEVQGAVKIPVDEKTGVKMYEQGVPVDQAIADMEADGLDVNAEADLAINEAQTELNKIGQPKTRAERVKNDARRKELQNTVDYYNKVKERWAEVQQTEVGNGENAIEVQGAVNSEENINVQPEQPIVEEKPVSSQSNNLTVEEQKQQRIAEAKEKYGELFGDDFTKANDVFELVSMWVGRKRNLAWNDVNGKRGLQKELGWTRKIGGDTKYIETLLAKNGEGVGVDEFAHMVWESPENDVMGEKRWTDQEIKEALLELLKSAQSKSDVVDYALNTRIAQAEAALQEQQEAASESEQQTEIEPLTNEEIQAMEANMPFAKPSDKGNVVELLDAIDELRQQEGMPQIKLVDTDRMGDDEWYDIASNAYGGVFVSNEEIEEVKNYVLGEGVWYNETDNTITIFSDSQTAEDVTNKINSIYEQITSINTVHEEGRNEGRDSLDSGTEQETSQTESGKTPAAETGNGSESQGSPESVDDPYLQPRNAEEEQIILDTIAQLQREIGEAIDEQNKATSELQKAMARESERATDMFGNDNALNQPGQLFDNSDMPIDQSVEGVKRRTAAEREKQQEAINKVNRLQSLQERNSRIRGALDSYRRQTSFETNDPMEAIEQTAQEFKREQEEKQKPKSNNKVFTDEAHEEVLKKLRAKFNNLNAGFDPEIALLMLQDAGYHIEKGARKIAECAKAMIDELGDFVRPYIKSAYNAVRDYPGMEEIANEMSSFEEVRAFDPLNFDKAEQQTVNVNKGENNEPEYSVSLQEKSVSEEQKEARSAFVGKAREAFLKAMKTGEKPFKSITDLRKFAQDCGMEVDTEGRDDILLQELVENALVRAAREYLATNYGGSFSKEAFDDIVKLYYLQPTISQRSSNRIKMQQYSTPLPMSFVADAFVYPATKNGMVLEPTAGNGMLVFGLEPGAVHANELDNTRLDNLQQQAFAKVTNQDATQPFEGEQYDAIVANPPFGSAPAKMYDGKEIGGLEEQITLNALSKMKDDGKAAIIIGGNMEYGPNGAIKSDKAFFTYLYDHYNVKGVIDMDGKLYSRQGTTYPTRMILIDGRRSEEERAQTKVYPPVQSMAPKKATTFDELFEIAEKIRNFKYKTNGNEVLRSATWELIFDFGNETGQTDQRRDNKQSRKDAQERTGRERKENEPSGSVQRGMRSVLGQRGQADGNSQIQREGGQTNEVPGQRGRVKTNQSGGNQSGRTGGNPSNATERVVGGTRTSELAGRDLVTPKEEEKRELNSDKLRYRPHNTAFSLQSVAPAAMVEAMDANLSKIEREHGNIDAFVTRELGYDSIDDMHNALAAEQVDSVAMAIYQMQHGQAMIIGDQTGVGKGRQMAALIRWACRQGKKPIFFTKDPNLFSDIYRDLVDVGSEELRPFILNDKGTITDADGRVVYKPLTGESLKRVLESEKLPGKYDFLILNYDQISTGDQISQEEAKEAAKNRGERYQRKKGKEGAKKRSDAKATFVRAIAKDNYLLLDESHLAAGKSNRGAYIQSILKSAKAATFASATFASRPDNMPMYALRTAMSKAKVKADELIKIIENGGVTLQEIMSRALTQAGQMVRRERDMSDVVTDWKTVDDPAVVKKARENYDKTIEAFNAIIDFQRNWVSGYLDRLSKDLADVAASAGMRHGTEDLGIRNQPFASKAYNYTKQLMLALKVDAIVDEVVKEIEAGRHPVIALENTMGSLLDEYETGDEITDTTFAASLLRGLRSTLRYTIKDEDGKQQQAELKPSDLGPDGEAAYHAVEDLIRESTSGIFISPLDAIIQKLQAKGYSVGELTGREDCVVLDENTGKYVKRRRTDKDKKKLARDFNSGALDVIILNKAAATGISLHASEKFSDQRQRSMIIAQPLSVIADYMQMIGRIDRTGQVHRGYYINLGLPVPAEGRFLMMLSTKLKSLNANTTTSQENESNDVEAPDLLNKYGSRVVVEYLRDNPDIYVKIGEPLKRDKGRVPVQELDSYEAQEDDARKITGYVALLPTAEQDAFYNDVVRRYNELIKYLNDTGSNDLKISVLPLRARTIDKQVSSEGSDPNGSNPFAGNAYVEWVEMDVLKKPMKAAEVGKVIEQLNPEVSGENAPEVQAKTRSQEKMLNERMTPRVKQILDTVEKEYQAKLEKENKRYDESKAKAEEAIKEQTEKINASKRTPEQKKEAIEKYKSDRTQAVEETHNNMVNKIEASHDRIARPLQDFQVGDSYLVPDDLDSDTFMGASPAIFCGFKAKDEGITPSTTLAVFCTLDGRRKIEIKLSDWGPLVRIKNHTEQNWDAAHEVTLSNWDSQVSNETRKHGFIMTGNILQAFADAGNDGKVPGQLVTYTDIDGNIRDGILMGQHWEPSQLKGSSVPIKNRENEIAHMPVGEHITSADGNVVIERFYSYFTISVPKSKKTGGQYYENDRLLNLVDGHDFYPHRGTLAADVSMTNIRQLVEVLNDLGVQIKSDNQVQFDTETEMGQAVAEEHKEDNGSGRRYDMDIEGTVESEIDAFKDEYNSVETEYVDQNTTEEEQLDALGRDALRKDGAPQWVIDEFEKEAHNWLSNPKVKALYNYVTGKIHIFAWRMKPGRVERPLFHENIHALLDKWYGFGNKRGICERFWNEAPDDGKVSKQFIIDNYSENDRAEELFTHWLGSSMEDGTVDEMLALINDDGDKQRVQTILNEIGYDKAKETARRKARVDAGGVRRNDSANKANVRDGIHRSGRGLSAHQQRIAKHIDKLVEKLGTKARTTVYHSFEELPEADKQHIREAEKRGRKVRGWYENGQVYLYLPNIDSEYQAEKTIWHETVAHHGLRELIGAENLDKLLKQLWLTHNDGPMGEWVAKRMQENGWRLNEAIEEYLAREAEKNPFKEPGLWQRLRWMLAEVLHKMGFASDPAIADVQYLFWQSQNLLRNNDPMGVIKQQAFLFNLERQAANAPYVNMNAGRVEDIYNPEAEGAYDDGVRHSEETDEEVIERLEKEPKVKVYRAMQLIDGKLYPPMAAKQNGKLVNPIELGKWEKADEHPEMADENGKFKLDKGNGKSLKAAYNPYIHTSTTMLNDQFSEAQNRDNLVVVEVEVPESELTSGYKAEKAKDSVGKLEWKAGVIQGQLSGTREVILSRWDKPIRIVPTEEVARHIYDMIKGKVEVMPTNVVTPQQRAELEKLGVKFVETDNRGFIKEGENAGKSYSSVYSRRKTDGHGGRRYDEDIESPLEYSAKKVYDERLNRVETVFSEAYQDAMVSLKTAQNAIAQDKDIPDSQNAYMAENLMHGKNKNEQDLYNSMFRDPLIQTINKIMNLTGMNWGDIDRYVYTKSGLERNREFFVRDWLEVQRNKTPHSYEEMDPEEQVIYDSMAATIETMFEDGDITEEEKNKKLAQALQKAHQRYIDRVEADWVRVKDEAYQDLKDGVINYAEYLDAMTGFIQRNIGDYKPEEHDYSGFRAMFGDEEGRYNEAAIVEELMETEGAINDGGEIATEMHDGPSTVDTLWEQINAATRYGLERYREAGMRSDEQIDKVEQMFHFYVPMRGFKEETGEDMYQYFTGKDIAKSYVGGLLKHAKGRGSEANYPISTIFAMSYKAIADCNQNLVNQKLYRLCQANPNDLVILSDSWAVFNEATGEWEEVAPEIPEDADEEEVRQITLAWQEQMQELAKENKAKKIHGKATFDYKPMDKKKQSEHIVDVRINGQPKKMIVTGNPRMAQALNGQLRFEHGKNIFRRLNAAIKNMMASLFTSYSPTFALRNMFRDWTHFRMMLGVREGHGYAAQANKYYRQSLFKMVGLFKKYREGTLDENKEIERDFKDFMDNGGITGFVFMQKIDDIQKQMEKLYKQQKQGKTIRLNNKLWEYTLGLVEAVNEGIENNARFATYRASRHYAGRTRARSAYDAKEITVNFNRKGAGSKTAGFKSQNKMVEDAAKAFGVSSQILAEGRIFFNATVQAIATTFKNFQNPDGSLNGKYIAKWAAKYAIPPFMFGLLLPAINKALANALGGGDDDDPYANLPEWTRRKNICLYAGNWGGNDYWITIPIGPELAAFLALGDIVAGNTYAPDLKPVDVDPADDFMGVMNTFSPVDISTKITKGGLMKDPISEVTGRTFSVLAPLVAVEQNLGWTGRPIYREDKFQDDQYTPEYQMVYQSTNPVLVNASKLLHELGSGDDVARGKMEVNPAIIQYLWEQYTGGPGKVFSNTISIGKDAKDILMGNESDFNVRKVEGLKAFVQQGDEHTQYYRTKAKYYKYKNDAEKLYHDVKGYENAATTDPTALMKLEEITKGEDFVRMQIIREADKQLSQINKAANKAEGRERKELRRLYNEQVKAVVDMLDEVGK